MLYPHTNSAITGSAGVGLQFVYETMATRDQTEIVAESMTRSFGKLRQICLISSLPLGKSMPSGPTPPTELFLVKKTGWVVVILNYLVV